MFSPQTVLNSDYFYCLSLKRILDVYYHEKQNVSIDPNVGKHKKVYRDL